jgi:agmatinase
MVILKPVFREPIYMSQIPQFLGEELSATENTMATARFEVVPCGLEATVSYGTGAARGPQAILEASQQLERLVAGKTPCAEGIFTHPAVDCDQPIERVMNELRTRTREISARGHVPVTLGGEHSISYGAVMGVVDGLTDAGAGPIGLVHIDAHADFRDAYQGHKHSHASVMNLLAAEGLPMASFGVRALAEEEEAARRAHGVITFDGPGLVRAQTASVTLPDDFPKNIYVTFDVDGLDPSVIPATGTPVPGGLGFYQALDLIESTLVGRRCVGIDIVELAPIEGQSVSDFTAASIAYHLMKMAL